MASYHDDYDSRSRSSRRNGPSTSSRDEYYLMPTTGASDPPRRVREKSSEDPRSGYGSQRPPNRYANDPRYDYPPPLPPDLGRPPRRAHSRNRKRYSWPPAPACEDEFTSLAKEAGTQQVLKNIRKDEAASRGRINQEPLIEDVPEFINKDEQRFVLSSREKGSSAPPTPPTSEDEKTRKAKRRPSKLDMNFNRVDHSVPEMNRRPASPYTFSHSRNASKEQPLADRYPSPESFLSPPPTDTRSRQRGPGGTRSQPSSPRRDSERYNPSLTTGSDYFSMTSSESAIDDTDRKPATYRPARDVPPVPARTSTMDFAPPPSATSVRRLNLDARRNTDTESTMPTLAKLRVDKSRGPNSRVVASALSDLGKSGVVSSPTTVQPAADFPLPGSRASSYVSSRAVSPANNPGGAGESSATTRSNRMSAEFSQYQSTGSSPTSRNGSVTGSRPSSPSPRTPAESPRLPRTDLDWSALIAANAARRPKPGSRLSSSLRQETMPTMPAMPADPALPTYPRMDTRQSGPRTDSLPYPIDDGPATPTSWMPSEGRFQYFADTKPTSQTSIAQDPPTIPRTASSVASSSSYLSSSSSGSGRTIRPSFQQRHSTAETPQVEKRPALERPKANDSRRVSFSTSSQAKKDLQALMKKGLPSCPRTAPVAGHDDWYTLIGAPNLDFCPVCIDSVFEKTVFRNYFRRSPPLNLNTKVNCSLGGMPWIRLAWLFTIQQQRTDLNLLKDLADIEETSREPCPGDREAVRAWYGLRDSSGIYVNNFYICFSDVRKIERLLPTLGGLFVRIPYRMTDEKHVCAIRPEGNRFSAYMDGLITMHEKALEYRRGADPSVFIEMVRRRQRLRECSKDSLLLNGLWHFIPSLPELTVCEDCFETVIEPEAQKNSDLVMRFNRTVQPVYGEGIGSSCQLYSKRMREVFRKAIERKDIKYLANKAKERREAELRLQEKYRYVIQKAKRLSWENAGLDDERRLDREIARITTEWKQEWE